MLFELLLISMFSLCKSSSSSASFFNNDIFELKSLIFDTLNKSKIKLNLSFKSNGVSALFMLEKLNLKNFSKKAQQNVHG